MIFVVCALLHESEGKNSMCMRQSRSAGMRGIKIKFQVQKWNESCVWCMEGACPDGFESCRLDDYLPCNVSNRRSALQRNRTRVMPQNMDFMRVLCVRSACKRYIYFYERRRNWIPRESDVHTPRYFRFSAGASFASNCVILGETFSCRSDAMPQIIQQPTLEFKRRKYEKGQQWRRTEENNRYTHK